MSDDRAEPPPARRQRIADVVGQLDREEAYPLSYRNLHESTRIAVSFRLDVGSNVPLGLRIELRQAILTAIDYAVTRTLQQSEAPTLDENGDSADDVLDAMILATATTLPTAAPAAE